MNKKTYFILIVGIVSLVGLIVGMSYAFFQYDRVGGSNVLQMGAMQFSSSHSSVTLQNVYPIPSYTVGTDLNNVMDIVVTISGKTTYDEGIEYAISFTDINATVNYKEVPISTKISASSALGTLDSNYYNLRGVNDKVYYAKEGIAECDEKIFVGYLPSSNDTTSGTITFKVYLDDATIGVSDTYDGSESKSMGSKNDWADGKVVLTTAEWNTLRTNGISFKVRVEAYEGIWYNTDMSLYTFITSKLAGTVSYVKSYTNEIIRENPTFTTQDTVSDNNSKREVFYFTEGGSFSNANVLFAGYCWQIVRTTDNGGVKLVYNGIAYNNQCGNRDPGTTRAVLSTKTTVDLRETNYLYGDGFDYNKQTEKFSLVNSENSTRTWTAETFESFVGKYTCMDDVGTNCTNIYYIGQQTMSNITEVNAVKIKFDTLPNKRLLGTSLFNVSYSSLGYFGYMFNRIYPTMDNTTTGLVYGKNVEYSNGNYLVVYDTPGVATDYTNLTSNINTHYTCGILDGNNDPVATCPTVQYFNSVSSGHKYYIELSGGEVIEDALRNMINYRFEGDNTEVNINVKSSPIKNYIELWYDKSLKDYEDYIDQSAVYCNNRKVTTLGGWLKTSTVNAALSYLTFLGSVLDLSCENDYDRFSKENNKARIKNPIGLLTLPEARLMGSNYTDVGGGYEYWTLTPIRFDLYRAQNGAVHSRGTTNSYVSDSKYVRPVITLNNNAIIEGGTGTTTKPYQIGPLVTVSQ